MTARTLPPLPTTWRSPQGPVRVSLVAVVDRATPQTAEEFTLGSWFLAKRLIQIQRDLPLSVQWSTFYHEQMHALLDDSGVANLLSGEMKEAICDAYGTARVIEQTAKL